jgi:hypothetical protein
VQQSKRPDLETAVDCLSNETAEAFQRHMYWRWQLWRVLKGAAKLEHVSCRKMK